MSVSFFWAALFFAFMAVIAKFPLFFGLALLLLFAGLFEDDGRNR